MYEQDEQDLPPGFVLDQQTSDLPPGFVLDSKPTAVTQEPVPMGPPAPVKRTAADMMKEKIGGLAGDVKSGKLPIPFDPTHLELPGMEEVKPIGTAIKDLGSMKYWGRVFKKDFWSNVGKNLMETAGDAFVDPNSPVGIMRSTKQMAETAASEQGFPTAGEEVKSAVNQVVSFAPPVFIGKVIAGMLTDPVGTIERDPFGVIVVSAGFSGEARRIHREHMAGKPIVPKDMRKILPDLKKWAMDAQKNAPLIEKTIESAKRSLAAEEMFRKTQQSPEPETPFSYQGILYKPADVTGGGARPKPDPTGESQMRGYEALIKGRTDVIPLEELITGEPVAGQPPATPLPAPPQAPIAPQPPPAQPGAVKLAPKVEPKAKAGLELTAESYKKQNPHSGGALTGDAKAFDALPPDAEVWVFHATSPENASALISGSGKATPQGGGINGKSSGIYVGSDPFSVSGYGTDIVAIKVKKAQLSPSPEAKMKGSLGEAVTDAGAGAVVSGKPLEIMRVGRDNVSGYEAIAKQRSKEPWRMTLDEYGKNQYSLKNEQLIKERSDIRSGKIQTGPFTKYKTKAAGVKAINEELSKDFPPSSSLWNPKRYGDHYQEVSRALREGKPVPPEVIRDYPDLAKSIPKAPSPPAATAAPPKPLDLTSNQMKMGLDAFDASTKELYAGMPVSKEVLDFMKKGLVVPGQAKDRATGAPKTIPTKITGPGDRSAYVPSYTTAPKEVNPDSFTVLKNAGGQETGMPGFKHELETLKSQKDMPATWFKHEYENPVRWFDNSPFLKDSLYYPWRQADHVHMLEKIGYRKQIGAWKHKVPVSMEKDLGAYAIAKQRNGPQTLQAMGIDPAVVVAKVEANPNMMKVYGEARSQLETMFARINKAREIAGMPPLPKVENYFTFARGVNDLEAIGVNPVTVSDPAMIKRHLYEPTFQYKAREGVIGPMSLKFYGIYEHYMNTSSRYSLYAPVVAKGRVLLGDWPAQDSMGRDIGAFNLREKAPNLYNQTNEWVDRIAGKHITHNAKFGKALSAVARNTGAAVIAFNPRSAIIQPTSLHNTYIEVGGKFLVKGIEEYALKENRQLAMRESNVLTGRAMDFHLEDLWASGVASKINNARSSASAVGTYPLRALDAMSAQISWLAAYEKGKADGLTGRALVNYADDVVVKTQASAKIGDVARIQTTPMGKLATVFQTFVINNWNYWSKDVFGWKNPEMATADRVKKVSRLVFGAVIINSLFEDVLNINSPLPAPEREIVKGIREGKSAGEIGVSIAKELAESIPVIGGTIKYTTPSRQSLPPGVQQVYDVAKIWGGVQSAIEKADLSKIRPEHWEAAAKILGVPGAAQAKKIFIRVKAGEPIYNIIVGSPLPDKNQQRKVNSIR